MTDVQPMVGRDEEVALVTERFAAGERHIGVVGPPGVGKTRFAQRLVERANHVFGRGPARVTWCEMADVVESGDVIARIAGALELPQARRRDDELEALASWLSEGAPRVLILDNVEQIARPVALLLAHLRRHAPQTGVVFTSRTELEDQGQSYVRLAPLAVETDAPAMSDASTLFLGFAGRSRDGLDAEERSRVDAIVRRLDGLPLGLELAAGRLDTLSLPELDERLADKFAVVRDGDWPSGGHDRSLWLTLEWSWNLLAPWQQQALAQLSVFRGAPDLALAEAVLELPGRGPMAPTVIDALQVLLRHHLLTRRDHDGVSRYEILPTIREFGRARLGDDERDAVWARFEAAVARAGCDARLMAKDPARLDERNARFAALRPDLLAVIRGDVAWAGEQNLNHASDAAWALSFELSRTGEWRLALDLLRTVIAELEAEPETDDAFRLGRLLRQTGRLLSWRGEGEAAQAMAQRAFEVASQCDDIVGAGYALETLASSALVSERLDEAERWIEAQLEMLAPFAAALDEADADDPRGQLLGTAYGHAASAAQLRNDFDLSRQRQNQALQVYRQTDRPVMEATALNALAALEISDGRHDAAEAALSSAREIATRLDDERRLGMASALASWLDFERGEATIGGVDAVIEHFDRLGAAHHVLVARATRAICLVAEGQLPAARLELEAVRGDLAASSAYSAWHALVVAALGATAAAMGDDDAAGRARAQSRADVPRFERWVRPHLEVLDAVGQGAGVASGDFFADETRSMVAKAAQQLDALTQGSQRGWRVATDGSAFHPPDGPAVEVAHEAPRRLLAALLAARDAPPGGLSRDELFEAGWPGESIATKAAANRVYVALSKLRKLGLEPVLESRGGVYQLGPSARLEPVDSL